LANVDRFAKFFWQLIHKKILNVYVTKISTSPALCCYTTLCYDAAGGVILLVKSSVFEMTYNVSSGTLNHNTPYHTCENRKSRNVSDFDSILNKLFDMFLKIH